MAEKANIQARSRIGYGSFYHRGDSREMNQTTGIGSVIGGQVWVVKPDKQARAETPCLWMQAGVVQFKSCNNFYDCTTCRYDQAMQAKANRGKQMSWQDAMRRQPALARICRHTLTRRIGHRACAYDFHCEKCDFDQYFEDVLSAKTKSDPTWTDTVKGFDLARHYHYHDGHTWARIESGGYMRVGLDDFSQKVFGRADGFELPLMGKEMNRGEIAWGLKRRDNPADVLAPVDGVIVEVNHRVRQDPGLVSREPYGDGWLFLVRTPDVKASAKKLMGDDASLGWINTEVGILEEMVTEVAGPLAADGGTFGPDLYGNLPGLDWKKLTRTFLKTD
jgi:glycine cleavage system H lipoate-binding protein/uncharacterized CHY-type Zn-finger protein